MAMSSEIEDIRKQLRAIENSIKELTGMDLFIAQEIVARLVSVEVNLAGRTMRGEEAEKFRRLFWEKADTIVGKRLNEAKTPAAALKLVEEFDKEISDFIQAAKVDTADKAMEIAHSFIKKYSPVALPLKAVREKDVWLVDIDVGALAVKIAKVKVDARTGDILSYEIPEKK